MQGRPGLLYNLVSQSRYAQGPNYANGLIMVGHPCPFIARPWSKIASVRARFLRYIHYVVVRFAEEPCAEEEGILKSPAVARMVLRQLGLVSVI